MKMTEQQIREYLSVKQRKDISLQNYAWPDAPDGPKYPCDTQDHLDACATLIGRAPDAEQAKIKARAIAIAKRLKLALPDTWKAEVKEDASTTPYAPKSRVAVMTVRFLQDDARSRNGRIYPHETLTQIVESGQRAIERGEMLTCYTSHGAADAQDPFHLSGKLTRVWQERESAFASIDIPDTSAGRDMVALSAGGYLKTVSLRAKNAELKIDPNYDMPIVTGHPQLEGIDFAPTPGISTATIQQITLENAEQNSSLATLCDEFVLEATAINLREEQQPHETTTPDATLRESEQRESMGKKTMTREDAFKRIHAHTAAVLDSHVKDVHGKGDKKAREAFGRLKNAHAQHLASAHDTAANQLGLDCESAYEGTLGSYDPDGDGDFDLSDDPILNPDGDDMSPDDESPDTADDMEESHKPVTPATTTPTKGKTMTPEEMIAALKASGYAVEAPKTETEKLQEAFSQQLAALRAEQTAQLDELKKSLLTQTQAQQQDPTQRLTMVESANVVESPSATVKTGIEEIDVWRASNNGDYLREALHPSKWCDLLDRTKPLPVDATIMLQESSKFLYDMIAQQAGF